MPWFKRAYRGLYGNRMIGFGNKVSFAENKSRRTWKPNVQIGTLWSETLQEKFKYRMTTYVMRCIKKKGGFDQYLLSTKDSEIKFYHALKLKERIKIVLEKRTQSQQQQHQPKQQQQSLSQSQTEIDSPSANLKIEQSNNPNINNTNSIHSNTPLQNTPRSLTSHSRGLLDIL